MRCRVYSSVWDRLFSVPHPQSVNCCGPLRVQFQLNNNRITYLRWSWLCPSACRLRGSCPVKSITQQLLTTLAEHLHFFTTGFSGRPKQSSDFDPSFCFLIHYFDFRPPPTPSLSLLQQLRKRFSRVIRNKKHPFVLEPKGRVTQITSDVRSPETGTPWAGRLACLTPARLLCSLLSIAMLSVQGCALLGLCFPDFFF